MLFFVVFVLARVKGGGGGEGGYGSNVHAFRQPPGIQPKNLDLLVHVERRT